MLTFDRATYLPLLFKFISILRIEKYSERIRYFTILENYKYSIDSFL